MTGFLNAHGTSMALYGHFISLSCENDDDVAALENAGPITYPDVDREVFEDELDDDDILCCELTKLDTTGRADLMECPYWNFDVEHEPVQYADIKEWYYATMSAEESERIATEAAIEAAAEQLERELEEADSYLPSFSSNHDKRRLTYSEAEHKWYRANFWSGRNRSKKQAKFSIDGKRARKSSRNHRFGNRQEFAQLRDFCADLYEEMLTIPEFVDYQRIPEFGLEVVGLTDDEASYYETEARREAEAYERELDRKFWFDHEAYEPDFAPVLNMNQYIWDHEENPYRYRDYMFVEFNRIHDISQQSYRFSYSDYYDDWYDDFGYYDQFYEYDDERHGIDLDEVDFGPTLEEWLERDWLEIEQMMDEEADRFSPSFVGSRRSTLRYHVLEPRRGKIVRKYSRAASYFYRAGRPYTATAH